MTKGDLIMSRTKKVVKQYSLVEYLQDRANEEFNRDRNKYNALITLKALTEEAENPNNPEIYFMDGRKTLNATEIPSFTLTYGTDFCKEGMRNKLLCIKENYRDEDGNYLMQVGVTLDLDFIQMQFEKVLEAVLYN